MRIIAVVVTCNRPGLLPRALNSIRNQTFIPTQVLVISNSNEEIVKTERDLCDQYGFVHIVNYRTKNYAGALNTGIEEIIKRFELSNEIYFASLDDDDEWLPLYLETISNANDSEYDLLSACYLRKSNVENQLMLLPEKLEAADFLKGNPGIGGSNTFIRLVTLLTAGCFDESLPATIDRDILFRVFQLKPKYKVINEHLVSAYTDLDRVRVTTNRKIKLDSYKRFYYKYRYFMNGTIEEHFFERAQVLFNIHRSEIESINSVATPIIRKPISIGTKGSYQFVIGFIAGESGVAIRIAAQIAAMNLEVDLLLVIDDTPKNQNLRELKNLATEKGIPTRIISNEEWNTNLTSGYYGAYFSQFETINSIPLGRTILHHHLYTETKEYSDPVFWIIDDDISFTTTGLEDSEKGDSILFDLINSNKDTLDAIIGGITNDAPVPMLCSARVQLLDYYYSITSNSQNRLDPFDIQKKNDYYYDLTDAHWDHLEMPIITNVSGNVIEQIFSGQAFSRPSLERSYKLAERSVTRRGANTIVFNRDLLHYYPVINLELNDRFVRRGDLFWAILNQVVSSKRIAESSFSIDHNRPITSFDLNKEIEKAANDIIGYSFNKGILYVIQRIKSENSALRPKNLFEILSKEGILHDLISVYKEHLNRRRARFVMNYYRICGLLSLIHERDESSANYLEHFEQPRYLTRFLKLIDEAKDEDVVKTFVSNLAAAIWNYSLSITQVSEDPEHYESTIKTCFSINTPLTKLGSGAEGVVFTDNSSIYKAFYNIQNNEWTFLQEKAVTFYKCKLLESIECVDIPGFRMIKYPYHPFTKPACFEKEELISFLRFCKTEGMVYTNFKAENFIRTSKGELKLVDYGKSFEPFSEEKFINSIKRAYLLYKYPAMNSEDFRALTGKINSGQEVPEVEGWRLFYWAISPRKKEEILDVKIIEIIQGLRPQTILDYGAGKCKTAKAIKESTFGNVFVYDTNIELLKERCSDLPIYDPDYSEMKFDLILLNIVLCEMDSNSAEAILSQVNNLLLKNGSAIVSVCNPDFSIVRRTEFQNRIKIPDNLYSDGIIEKECVYTSRRRQDYFRPTDNYVKFFNRTGFTVQDAYDTEGVNLEDHSPSSDFKIFILTKND